MARRIRLRNKAETVSPSGLPITPGTPAGTLSDEKVCCDAAGASDGQESEDRQAEIAKYFIRKDPDDLIRIYIKKPGVFPRKEYMMESSKETVKIQRCHRGEDPEYQEHAYRPPEQGASA